MKTKSFIKIKNKNYPYILEKKGKEKIRLISKDANIDQFFLSEDIPDLILDLPNLIIAEQKYLNKQDEIIRFRISPKDKMKIEKKAIALGYDSVSKYLRDIALD